MKKKIELVKKKNELIDKKNSKISAAKLQQQQNAEAPRKIEREVLHQNEEAQTRALGRAMIADAEENRPSFNASCLKLLNHFQGN